MSRLARNPLRLPYKSLGLSQLRSFVAVCRMGGYSAAGREMRITGAAVWEQMKALQRILGLELLERQGNQVVPTAHGQRLLTLVRPHLAGLDSVQRLLREEQDLLPEQLTIVTNLRVIAEEISAATARFRERYPTIRIAIRYLRIADVQQFVLDGTADVTLTLAPAPGDPVLEGLVYEPAGELDYLAIAPAHHPVAKSRSFRLEMLTRYPLVLGDTSAYSRRRVEEVFHRHGLTSDMQVAAESNSDAYTTSLVRSGVGIGIGIGLQKGRLYYDLKTRSLARWFGTAQAGFVWRAGAHRSTLQIQLANELKATLR
ncbi:MAG TPA: LysR family transcriptional regulator [Caulifigura sp.]|nr:LysR family transcriptional regulator [Caulifigura sp.]